MHKDPEGRKRDAWICKSVIYVILCVNFDEDYYNCVSREDLRRFGKR